MSHVFKHPNYYKELRARNNLAQEKSGSAEVSSINDRKPVARNVEAISPDPATAESGRAPSSKLQAPSSKLQAASSKPQAPSLDKNEAQASSPKHKGSSFKPQASSSKILEPGYR
jgi:hypothetical protein